jgi:hypothetical protein
MSVCLCSLCVCVCVYDEVIAVLNVFIHDEHITVPNVCVPTSVKDAELSITYNF